MAKLRSWRRLPACGVLLAIWGYTSSFRASPDFTSAWKAGRPSTRVPRSFFVKFGEPAAAVDVKPDVGADAKTTAEAGGPSTKTPHTFFVKDDEAGGPSTKTPRTFFVKDDEAKAKTSSKKRSKKGSAAQSAMSRLKAVVQSKLGRPLRADDIICSTGQKGNIFGCTLEIPAFGGQKYSGAALQASAAQDNAALLALYEGEDTVMMSVSHLNQLVQAVSGDSSFEKMKAEYSLEKSGESWEVTLRLLGFDEILKDGQKNEFKAISASRKEAKALAAQMAVDEVGTTLQEKGNLRVAQAREARIERRKQKKLTAKTAAEAR